MSRDRNVCLPSTKGASGCNRAAIRSTSPHERDDFDLVAVAENALGMTGARDEFEVALDRQIARLHVQLGEQPGDRGAVVDKPLFAVDANFHKNSPQHDAVRSVGVRKMSVKEVRLPVNSPILEN